MNDDFIPIESYQDKERSLVDKAGGLASRAFETALGLPGDIYSLSRDVTGAIFPQGSQQDLSDNQKLLRNIFSPITPGGLGPKEELSKPQQNLRSLFEMLPNSEELRAYAMEANPEFEPTSEQEARAQETTQDITGLALSGTGFLRSLGISLGGQLGKEAFKQMGYGEEGQNYAKLGSMLFSGMFRKGGGVNSFIDRAYKRARNSFSPGEAFNYNTNAYSGLRRKLNLGEVTPSERSVLDFLDTLESKVQNGQMTVEEAMKFNQNINERLRSATKKTDIANLTELHKIHNKELGQYAKTNPTFAEAWKEGNQAFAGMANSFRVQDFIKRHANLNNLTHSLALLGMEEYLLPGNTLGKALSVGGVASGLYAADMSKRLMTNPALRKYYTNVVKAALQENAGALSRNLAGLEREAKKSFESNPLPDFESIDLEERQLQ